MMKINLNTFDIMGALALFVVNNNGVLFLIYSSIYLYNVLIFIHKEG